MDDRFRAVVSDFLAILSGDREVVPLFAARVEELYHSGREDRWLNDSWVRSEIAHAEERDCWCYFIDWVSEVNARGHDNEAAFRELHTELYRAYTDWLERRGGFQGEFIHLQFAAGSLLRGDNPFDYGAHRTLANPDRVTENVFLTDILRYPADATPRLVFADWLEERDDPRAPYVRLFTRLNALSEDENTGWLETFRFPSLEWPTPPLGYERFHDSARRVIQLANQEAQRFNHERLGTQHVLLAIVKEASGVAADNLARAGFSLAGGRREVEKLIPTGPDRVVIGKLFQTGRQKMGASYAQAEADEMRHDTITTEHLLLGLCRAQPCAATRVMRNLGLSPGLVCSAIVTQLGGHGLRWVWEHPEVW